MTPGPLMPSSHVFLAFALDKKNRLEDAEKAYEAAAALRGQGRAVLIVEPGTQSTEEQA